MCYRRDKSMEIADLKQRDEAIWQKYCQNVDEDDLVAIYRQGDVFRHLWTIGTHFEA